MQAIQLIEPATVICADVPPPDLAAGDVLVRVVAAGVCHTDIHIRGSRERLIPDGIILGHEIAGDVVAVSAGVTSVAVGERVVVHPIWSCGHCRMCVAGRQNACRSTGSRLGASPTPGVSVNGGMAELVAVPARAVVPAGDLDPALAAVLADAGLVPYHSINATRDLLRPGSTAVVVGVGGLGRFAVELLRELTAARVIALDVKDAALSGVRDRADLVLRADADDAVSQVVDVTAGVGADVVFDFVGSTQTMAMSASMVAQYGAIRVPGLGDGVFPFETALTAQSLPWGVSITRPNSGTYQDLRDLVELARRNRIGANLYRYDFAHALTAFDDLEGGRINGRAVIVMDGPE